MAIELNKLYLTRPHTQHNIGDPLLVELQGANVSVIMYGSKDKPATLTDLVPIAEELTEAGAYPLFALPRYVVFTGTADLINVEGYDLTDEGAIV